MRKLARNKKFIVLKFLLLWMVTTALLFTNSEVRAQQKMPFTFEEYRRLVKSNHPYSKQAGFQKLRGESAVRRARGNFDPKLEASFNNKDFQNKDYYSLTSASIKIPTAAAVELKAGFDRNTGEYVNGESITPDDGLFVAGISLPVLQGLFIDERRTALAQAKAFNEFSIYEQEVLMNDLMLSAFNSYWEWWAAYEKELIAAELLSIATDRFRAVRDRAVAGQAPIIDTVEANIQVLMRSQNLQEAKGNEIKFRLALSSFVWDDKNEVLNPRIITESFAPTAFDGDNSPMQYVMNNYLTFLDSIEFFNPYLRQFDAKLTSVEAEERMKREKLKPKLNLNYNLLAEPTGSSREEPNFSTNNYKWGVDFGFPLLLRAERGDLQLTRIKLAETKLEQQQKTAEIKNKAGAVYQNIFLLRSQIEIAERNVSNYFALLEGERIKFFNGESSLFLVNQRELQYADSRTKLIDLKMKLSMTENELSFLLGVID